MARLGGDEFGVILPGVGDLESARQHAARIEQAVSRPFRFESCPLNLRASIGIAVFPPDATELEPLLERADQGMYVAKRERKGRVGESARLWAGAGPDGSVASPTQ